MTLQRNRSLIRELCRGFDRLIYPPDCLLCAARFDCTDGVSLCPECRRLILTEPYRTCPHCAGTVGPYVDLADGCPSCREESFQFESVIRLGPYDGKLRDAILHAKHLTGEILAESIAQLWVQRDGERLRAWKPDVVVPVPLYWLRRIERGYNQSAALAVTIGETLGTRVGQGWLRRVRPTSKQFTQSASARRENVAGAFRASLWCRVRGMRVLLVDDVMTTGATANEVTKVLKAAGAAQVFVAVLARR